MPLTVNVGISRKASANYQSAGHSISLTAELDQSLLADPPRLQSEIDRIYRQAEEALDRKAGGVTTVTGVTAEVRNPPNRPADRQPVHHRNGSASNGHAAQNGATPQVAAHGNAGRSDDGFHGGPVRPATESQMRALRAICKRGRLDLDREVYDEFGVESADHLDVRQASQMIDGLKQRQQAVPEGRGRFQR
jgi:hypothetical protein